MQLHIIASPKGITLEAAYKTPYSMAPNPSKIDFAAGHSAESNLELPFDLTEKDVTAIKDGNTVMHIFSQITYKDLFKRVQHTNSCGFYQPSTDKMALCGSFNMVD